MPVDCAAEVAVGCEGFAFGAEGDAYGVSALASKLGQRRRLLTGHIDDFILEQDHHGALPAYLPSAPTRDMEQPLHTL